MCVCVCVCVRAPASSLARLRVCTCQAARLSHLRTQRKEPPPKQKGLWRFKGVVLAVFIHTAHGASQERQ